MFIFNLENRFGLHDNASDLASWLQVLRRQIAASQAKREAEIWNWAIMENCAWMRWLFGWSHRACCKTEDCACSGPHGKNEYLPPWEQTFFIYKKWHHTVSVWLRHTSDIKVDWIYIYRDCHLKHKFHCSFVFFLRLITNHWCQPYKKDEYKLMRDGNYFWRKRLPN